ncbi:hypothetical protein C7H19_24050 [Aphanothece hegewaldii CCALA 016]|uniref:DUF1257 domain-containing protein n=1 Tax=Aphanothece hegewaldii CCALA 016 TaxID=2107694 RepID=A0A2T1LQX2_9CHRO|nr:DUF1257 domain-containing protein [Aphanothece hegewaldii]PSF30081.1 hypothetical protein C7H19_24050 [Aphanothece hegewaldii CCALA 016]
MSHFTKVKTEFKDQNALITAIKNLKGWQVEVHETEQHLYGYRGDRRQQVAHLIVRREQINPASNDLGFHRSEDGIYNAIISEWDAANPLKGFIKELTKEYSVVCTENFARSRGMTVERTRHQDGRLQLRLLSVPQKQVIRR